MLKTAPKLILICTKFDSFVTCLKAVHDFIVCHIPSCFCPLLPHLLIGWLVPDEAITGLQLNPSNIEFSATIYTGYLALSDKSSSAEGNRLNTLKLPLIPLNPFVRIISEVYLRDM